MRVRISARQSDLARLQAYRVGEALKSVGATEVTFQFRSSLGDLNQTDPLWKMPEKGVFTEDFVRDLTDGTADMVVHSWKDLPTIARKDTEIVATLPRADTRDLLLFRRDRLAPMREKGVVKILTSSPRRSHNLSEFLLTHLPCSAVPSAGARETGSSSTPNGPEATVVGDLPMVEAVSKLKSISFEPVRGNIPTRLKKLIEQDVDGLIVAKAALDRLISAPEPEFAEAQSVIRAVLKQTQFMVLPLSINPTAAAQGALAIEIHKNRPELAALVAKLNCQETFDSVNEERKILASYGGGCHQKIGVTILNRDFGKITYLRGQTDHGETLAHVKLECNGRSSTLSQPDVSASPNTRVFPEEGEDGTFFEREVFTGTELEVALGKLTGSPAIYVARENALPLEFQASNHQLIWTAGLRTWQKLAARGIWVNGSSEGLGEREPMQIDRLVSLPNTFEWTKVSHEDSNRTSISDMKSVATYRLKTKTRLPDLRDRTHFYWMSGSSFERAVSLFPEIKNKNHASGPGHTHQYLLRALGESAALEGRIQIALDLDSWRNDLKRHK